MPNVRNSVSWTSSFLNQQVMKILGPPAVSEMSESHQDAQSETPEDPDKDPSRLEHQCRAKSYTGDRLS